MYTQLLPENLSYPKLSSSVSSESSEVTVLKTIVMWPDLHAIKINISACIRSGYWDKRSFVPRPFGPRYEARTNVNLKSKAGQADEYLPFGEKFNLCFGCPHINMKCGTGHCVFLHQG